MRTDDERSIDRGLLVAGVIAVALAVCVEQCRDAHARAEAPPLVTAVRRLVPRLPHVEQPEAPRHASEAPGVCEALPDLEDGDEIPERREVERVLRSCSRAGRHSDPFAVLAMVRVEVDMGAPVDLLTSAACWETGFQGSARRGDWLDGVARAHGPLQLHGVFLATCRLTDGARDSAEAAARCYLSRVFERLPDARLCPHPWTVAEALVANRPKYLPWGCAAKSLHAAERERWAP